MAVRDKSLFLYGFYVDGTNKYLPFKAASGGPEILATIQPSFYTLRTLCTAIALALNTADTANTYTVSVDRTLSSNLQNRITISTSGIYLSLLFSTSTYAATSIRDMINFGSTDRTGATTYTNSITSGTALQTTWYAKNYQAPTVNLRTIGATNHSADGSKETIWWSIQQFITAEFQFEAQANVLAYWAPLITWMVKGRPFEFTPETNAPTVVYSVTLEKSSGDGKGLGFMMKEMVPDYPFLYSTGPMEFSLVTGTY